MAEPVTPITTYEPLNPSTPVATSCPQPRLGVMDTMQSVRTKIPRSDVLEHPTYNRFKHIMTYYVASPSVLLGLLGIGFLIGFLVGRDYPSTSIPPTASSSATPSAPAPPAVTPPTPAPAADQPTSPPPAPVVNVSIPDKLTLKIEGSKPQPGPVNSVQSEPTEAEKRNEALEQRLRKKYGI